jgi:hypothetical protein
MTESKMFKTNPSKHAMENMKKKGKSKKHSMFGGKSKSKPKMNLFAKKMVVDTDSDDM